ncbi:hypothetical protein HanRHA438_Chr12g0556611 [Helianthus annuus]|nr:hypothetical protein HanRHA438_Chr12g0556611 [Helianthus annuus]
MNITRLWLLPDRSEMGRSTTVTVVVVGIVFFFFVIFWGGLNKTRVTIQICFVVYHHKNVPSSIFHWI